MPDPAEARCAPGGRQHRWADLRTRVLSAVVLGPLGLLCLWWGGPVWAALIAAVAFGLLLEWRRLSRRMRGPLVLPASAGGAAAILSAAACLLWLRADPGVGRVLVLFVVLVVWASDIGAYVVGRLVGGPLLAPAISPAKTCSGALGSLAASVVAGAAVARGWSSGGAVAAVPAALLLGLAAQAGDLLESAAKRAAGMKDSGGLIPGHGGLLDRLDGLLAASLVAALLAMHAGRGVVFW